MTITHHEDWYSFINPITEEEVSCRYQVIDDVLLRSGYFETGDLSQVNTELSELGASNEERLFVWQIIASPKDLEKIKSQLLSNVAKKH